MAPGYLPERAFQDGLPPLLPIRYAIEFDAYRVGAQRLPKAEPDSLYAQGLAQAREIGVVPVAAPGLFVAVPGARFDRVVLAAHGFGQPGPRLQLVVQDGVTGTLRTWTLRGDAAPAVALPPGARVLSGWGPQGFPLIVRGDDLYVPRSHQALLGRLEQDWLPVRASVGDVRAGVVGRGQILTAEAGGTMMGVYTDRVFVLNRKAGEPPVVPDATVRMETVVPGSTGPIDCWAVRHPHWEAGIAVDPTQILLVAATPAGRSLFRLRLDERGTRTAEPVVGPALPADEITACAASRTALYLALRDQGIQKVEIAEELVAARRRLVGKLGPRVRVEGSTGPVNPVAMVVGPVRPDWDSTWEALYAVAGDEGVYRFDEDLKPDVRLKPRG